MNSSPFSPSSGGVVDPNQPTAEEQAKAKADNAVVEINSKTVEVKSSNTLAEAEAKEQAKVAEETKIVDEDDAEVGDTVHIAEQGSHKLITTKVNGLNHNFLSRCTCQWEGRFVTMEQAAAGAMKHFASKVKQAF
jgi:hypothetical protein